MTLQQLLASRKRVIFLKDSVGLDLIIRKRVYSYDYTTHTLDYTIITDAEGELTYNGTLKDMGITIKAFLSKKPYYYKTLKDRNWKKLED